MSNIDPLPPDGAIDEIKEQWSKRTDAFGRVYTTVLGITDFTWHEHIAEKADCAPNTAKKHLERLVDMGLVEKDRTTRSLRYRRNDAYLEWREASRIAEELTTEDIIKRVRELESLAEEFEERYGTDDPRTVTVFDQEDHDAIHEEMEAIGRWQGIERDIQLYELARQLVHNDGHLLPR